MFPHTITIFNITKDNQVVYNRKVVSDVFYYKEKSTQDEQHGDKPNYQYHVILSSDALKNYLNNEEYQSLEDKSNNFTLKINDIIVLGECESITDLIDLQKSNKEYFLIRTINDNQYGSEDLQNIEVTS